MAFGGSTNKKKESEGTPEEGATSAQGPAGAAAVKKSKSFKRIRGFLTGESRKQRKAKKAAAAAAAAATKSRDAPGNNEEPDDASTVFGVDVDDRSIATGMASSTAANFLKGGTDGASLLDSNAAADDENNKAYILKVVLLLMDPETRRFELLQLEFDSLKALVSDVLAQIPVSVTEEALRQQTYTGIAGKDGKEMPPSKLLASFCKGNEVLVAVPTGVDPKECARLARPILSDDKVVDMVRDDRSPAAFCSPAVSRLILLPNK
jgi:hypothetical protein